MTVQTPKNECLFLVRGLVFIGKNVWGGRDGARDAFVHCLRHRREFLDFIANLVLME
jgi:hypothetical protein